MKRKRIKSLIQEYVISSQHYNLEKKIKDSLYNSATNITFDAIKTHKNENFQNR